jgi:hypothetical protein
LIPPLNYSAAIDHFLRIFKWVRNDQTSQEMNISPFEIGSWIAAAISSRGLTEIEENGRQPWTTAWERACLGFAVISPKETF